MPSTLADRQEDQRKKVHITRVQKVGPPLKVGQACTPQLPKLNHQEKAVMLWLTQRLENLCKVQLEDVLKLSQNGILLTQRYPDQSFLISFDSVNGEKETSVEATKLPLDWLIYYFKYLNNLGLTCLLLLLEACVEIGPDARGELSSRVARARFPLSLPFQAPGTQAMLLVTHSVSYFSLP